MKHMKMVSALVAKTQKKAHINVATIKEWQWHRLARMRNHKTVETNNDS